MADRPVSHSILALISVLTSLLGLMMSGSYWLMGGVSGHQPDPPMVLGMCLLGLAFLLLAGALWRGWRLTRALAVGLLVVVLVSGLLDTLNQATLALGPVLVFFLSCVTCVVVIAWLSLPAFRPGPR